MEQLPFGMHSRRTPRAQFVLFLYDGHLLDRMPIDQLANRADSLSVHRPHREYICLWRIQHPKLFRRFLFTP